MIHPLRGTFEARDGTTVEFAGTYDYTPARGPTYSCGGQPPEVDLTIEWTDPKGYDAEAYDKAWDDPERYKEADWDDAPPEDDDAEPTD